MLSSFCCLAIFAFSSSFHRRRLSPLPGRMPAMHTRPTSARTIDKVLFHQYASVGFYRPGALQRDNNAGILVRISDQERLVRVAENAGVRCRRVSRRGVRLAPVAVDSHGSVPDDRFLYHLLGWNCACCSLPALFWIIDVQGYKSMGVSAGRDRRERDCHLFHCKVHREVPCPKRP